VLLSLLLSVNSMIPYVRVGVWCRVGWGLVGWLVGRSVGRLVGGFVLVFIYDIYFGDMVARACGL